MIIVAFATQLPPLMQFVYTLKRKSSDDISLSSVILAFISCTSWLLYGVYKGDIPLIIGNVIAVPAFMLKTYIVWRFQRRKKNIFKKN